MSEQSPLQSSVGVFVEWAKARLDEMAASAKVLESRLDSLDVNVRAQAEQAIAHVKQWIAEVQVSERIRQMGRTSQRPASYVSSARPGPGPGVAKRREQLYAARSGTPCPAKATGCRDSPRVRASCSD